MFIVQNHETLIDKRFETRDQLLLALDKENVVYQKKGRDCLFSILHYNQDGEILEKTELTLPIEGTADAFLLNFGLKKDKKGLLAVKKPKEKAQSLPSEKQPLVEKIAHKNPNQASVGQPPKKEVVLVKCFLTVFCLASFFLAFISFQKSSQITSLKTEVTELKNLRTKTPKIDIFSRYFLPNYFAGKTEVYDQFMLESVLEEDLSVDSAQLVSSIMESIKEVKDNYQVSYVLSLKYGESEFRTKRITLLLKEKKSSAYGYILVKKPKLTNFSH